MDASLVPILQAESWRVSVDEQNRPRMKGITVNNAGGLDYDFKNMPSVAERFAMNKWRTPDDCGGIDLNSIGGDLGRLTVNQMYSLSRSTWARQFQDPRARDIYNDCGYPEYITPTMYDALYNREGHAARVVDVLPDECWATHPLIYETESDDPKQEKPFEKAFREFETKMSLFSFMERIDKLSGIGSYGLFLIGLDDGKQLFEPAAGYNLITGLPLPPDKTPNHKVTFIRVFQETECHISRYCTDQSNPRHGMPEMYLVRMADPSTTPAGQSITDITTKLVHWTRVVHIADNRKSSEWFGIPRMMNVYNRLQDIRKVLSGSGEMYWKGAFPGFAFEVNPDLQDPLMDKESVREEFRTYSAGLQRYLAVTGVTVKSLSVQSVDPNPHLDAQLKAVAMAKAIPWRVFVGSESAQLASEQDTRAWNKRLGRRQENYLNPLLIRPIIDRLIAFGVLPQPGEYHITWPDLDTPTEGDRADVALKLTQALATYVGGDCDMLIPPREYLINVWGMKPKLADAIAKAMEKHIEDGDKLVTPETKSQIKKNNEGNQPDPAGTRVKVSSNNGGMR